MQNMWQFQTGDLFKICLWNHLSNILNLWNKSKPNKELRGRALSFVNCKWRTGVKLIQTARADSVIKCVLYSTTQNLGCFPWCQFEQKKDNYSRNFTYLFSPFLFWNLKIHNKLFSGWKPSQWQPVYGLCLTFSFFTFFSPSLHTMKLSLLVGWAGLALR